MDLCALPVNELSMSCLAYQRVSANRTDLEQLAMKLQAILSIVDKYRENDDLCTLDYQVENFCLCVGSLPCSCLFEAAEFPQSHHP